MAALRVHAVHRPVPRRCTASASRWFAWLVRQLAARGAAVYPAATQLAYKEKWAPHAVIPEYVAFQGRASLYGFLQVFNAANASDEPVSRRARAIAGTRAVVRPLARSGRCHRRVSGVSEHRLARQRGGGG